MKYESEIINEILEVRGHEKSSIHYESECIETWIEEIKGAYPKLTDYRSEWLNYILEHPIGDFPYVTLSDVTDATIENVVPYAYKSAILKGNTGYRDIDTGEILETFEEGRNLELVSVKMPVLTATGKNLLDPQNIRCNVHTTTMIKIKDTLKPNVSYSISFDRNGVSWNSRSMYVKSSEFSKYLATKDISNERAGLTFQLSQEEVNALNSDDGRLELYNVLITEQSLRPSNIQIEEGTVATTYEPHKTNILSALEDVELRGIGDIKDELNVLTGEIVERIITKTFTGNENITLHGIMTDKISFRLPFDVGIKNSNNGGKIICNTEKTMVLGELLKDDINAGVCVHNTDVLTTAYIAILKTELETHDVNGAKKWLSQNRPTVAVVLNQSNVKTVDLSIQNQDGNTLSTIKPIEGIMHLSTSGNPIKPTFSGEIPVEAITQNLASFIEE